MLLDEHRFPLQLNIFEELLEVHLLGACDKPATSALAVLGSEVSHLDRDYVARMLERIPLGRESGPEDAPAAIAFLCSEAAGFITGATLSVDGGNSIGTYQRPRAPE